MAACTFESWVTIFHSATAPWHSSLHCLVLPFAWPQCKMTPFALCLCSFMKLRLDRVLRLDLGSLTPGEALKSTAPPPEFPPLDTKKWTAPYPPYAPGWWKVFSPEQ